MWSYSANIKQQDIRLSDQKRAKRRHGWIWIVHGQNEADKIWIPAELDFFCIRFICAVMGILESMVIIFGVIALVSVSSNSLGQIDNTIIYVTGAIIIILIVPYLGMWILLNIKTRKQDMHGIEQIGKVYSYVSGSLEIIGAIAGILEGPAIVGYVEGDSGLYSVFLIIGQSVCATIYLIFACLKIHGIRVKKNKLLEAYIGFRYVFFILCMTGLAILAYLTGNLAWIAIIVGFVFFILDIGLTVILRSIRGDQNVETLINFDTLTMQLQPRLGKALWIFTNITIKLVSKIARS